MARISIKTINNAVPPMNENNVKGTYIENGIEKKCVMVADVGTNNIELPENENSIKGIYTDSNNKRHKVILVSNAGGSGPTPTGTIDITENGNYDVAQYANANVNVSGGGIPTYIVPKNNVNGVYQSDNTATSFSLNGATDVAQYGLANAFYNCKNLKSADLSSLVEITNSYGLYNAFSGSGLEGHLDLHNLVANSSASSAFTSAFSRTKITSVDLSGLITLSALNYGFQSVFEGCDMLTSVNLDSLEIITGGNIMSSCFARCSSLKELRFPAIKTTSFGTRVNQFNGMCTNCTDIVLHFPSNVESVIRGLSGYSDTKPFGATSGQVLFDLPSTEI